MIGALIDHLWQSTVFATAIAILVFAFRGNRARVRYWLWFTASLKFLIPFTALTTLGSQLFSAIPMRAATQSIVFVADITQPLLDVPISITPMNSMTVGSSTLAVAALVVWASGLVTLAFVRFRTWRRIRRAMNRGTSVALSNREIPAHVHVRSVPGLMEPAVVGLWRQTLLVPHDIDKHLTRSQLSTVVAHELCHVRHRDNLTAAIHMLVEAVCWFHPAVWLIGSRLIDERERACDEEVLMKMGTPQVYADAILNVCKRYVAAPSLSVAGISSANLRERIEAIMIERVGCVLNTRRKLVLATAAAVSLTLPVAAGATRSVAQSRLVLNTQQSGVNPQAPTAGTEVRRFEVASVKRNVSGDANMRLRLPPGGFEAINVQVRELIRLAHGLQSFQLVGGPDWLTTERFDIIAKADRDYAPGPEGASPEVISMVRTLLAERFGVRLQAETRELPLFELRLARSDGRLGSGMRRVQVDCEAEARRVAAATASGQPRPTSACTVRVASTQLMGRGLTPAQVAAAMSRVAAVNRHVIDRTELSGTFDIDLQWTPDPRPATNDQPPVASQDGPVFFTAVQEQLGLRLQAARGPAEVFAIVAATRPTEN